MNADSYGDALDCTLEEITKLREQVAAQAAVIEKLRDALAYCASDLRPEMQSRKVVATNALSIPTDSTQILAEVRRAEREQVAQYVQQGTGDWMLGKKIAEAIRAME